MLNLTNPFKNPVKLGIVLSILFCTPLVYATPALEAKIQTFVPIGHTVLAYQAADLNADGRQDGVLITEPVDDPRAPRLLQILENTAVGYKAYQNTQLIPCAKCGGPSEEPTFRALKVTRKSFSVQVYWGGIKNGYLKTLRFEYRPSRQYWFLQGTNLTRFDTAHQQDEQYATKHHRTYSPKTGLRFERVTYN